MVCVYYGKPLKGRSHIQDFFLEEILYTGKNRSADLGVLNADMFLIVPLCRHPLKISSLSRLCALNSTNEN